MSAEIKSKIAGYVSECQIILNSINQAKIKRDQELAAFGFMGRGSLIPELRKIAKMLKQNEYEKAVMQYQTQFDTLVQNMRAYFTQVSIDRRGLQPKGNSHVILKKMASLRSSSSLETKVKRALSVLYTLSEEPVLYTRDIQKQVDEQKKLRKDSAYLILRQLEQLLRVLIEKELSNLTSNWWKQRIPNDVRQNAEDRKKRNENPWPWHDKTNDPLITYLDFNDYLKVITKKDNWRDAFEKIFIEKELTSAKLRELDPIRKMIAHTRDLSDRDFARLDVNAGDLLEAIKKYHP